eukprot:177176-Pelagomonas_calceolata.AAC.1
MSQNCRAGSHRSVVYTPDINGLNKELGCEVAQVIIVHALPAEVHLDPYELESLSRSSSIHLLDCSTAFEFSALRRLFCLKPLPAGGMTFFAHGLWLELPLSTSRSRSGKDQRKELPCRKKHCRARKAVPRYACRPGPLCQPNTLTVHMAAPDGATMAGLVTTAAPVHSRYPSLTGCQEAGPTNSKTFWLLLSSGEACLAPASAMEAEAYQQHAAVAVETESGRVAKLWIYSTT